MANILLVEEAAMPTIPELLRDRVSLTLSVSGVSERLCANVADAALVTLKQKRGAMIASPVLLGEISQGFVAAVEAYAQAQRIPLARFQKGQRKDDIAAGYRRHFTGSDSVVFIGVAQEQQTAFKARQERTASARFQFSRQSVFVKVYYFYIQDSEFGPGFIKVGTYAPYPVKVCLNGHEWVKQQLRRAGVAFEALDNGFLSCADPTRLQALCQQLARPGASLFRQVVACLPV
jgi:hypothetical protein